MKLAFAILAFSTLVARAQTNEIYLFCRDSNVVASVIATIDSAFGYPNPATATFTAVDAISNGTNYLVPLTIVSHVYSPTARSYRSLADTLETKLTKAEWGTNVLGSATKPTNVLTNATARIDGALAAKIGFTNEVSQAALE